MGWIKVEDCLPELDVWVQVYSVETHFRQRVVPAKLEYVDAEGYAQWFLCYVGGSRLRHTRNVTHWKPMSSGPECS